MEKYDVKRVLVVSDSHGDFSAVANSLDEIGDIDLFIHLGDFQDELDYIEAVIECPKIIVRGNCDYREYSVKDEISFEMGDYKVLATHGHKYGVKMTYELIIEKAIEEGYDIVMFGHTHKRLVSNENGVLLINPGSVRYGIAWGETGYVILEIDENGELNIV